MKVFVIFGTIEFIDDTAYIHHVEDSGFMDERDIESIALAHDADYVIPHYYDGSIVFTKFHKEQ